MLGPVTQRGEGREKSSRGAVGEFYLYQQRDKLSPIREGFRQKNFTEELACKVMASLRRWDSIGGRWIVPCFGFALVTVL